MKFTQFILPAAIAGLLPVGMAQERRECCCDRYSQFQLPNAEGIVANCKAAWTAGEIEYCNSVFCIQQIGNPVDFAKCVVAGYQCGDCDTGNVGCLG
jgi:hypothetical protein